MKWRVKVEGTGNFEEVWIVEAETESEALEKYDDGYRLKKSSVDSLAQEAYEATPITVPNEIKEHLQSIAGILKDQKYILKDVFPQLTGVDSRAVKTILTDLAWAIENLTVVGLHQVGEALEDNMGFSEQQEI